MLGYDIVDVDTMVPIAAARTKMGPEQIILGNVATVDVMQRGNSGDVTKAVTQCHLDAGPRYVIGAGCEVPRETPVANMAKLQEYALTHKPE
jgi:uroporphyrinogen-III decarboxylase